MPTPKRHALLLINPESRLGLEQDLSAGIDILREHGCTVDEATLGKEGRDEIIPSGADKYDLLIIGGGDGTLSKMAAAVLASGLPLGVLPLGTGNNLARTLNIPFGIEEACRVIAEGNLKKVDLGRVNGSLFFNVASLGLSTEVIEELDQETKKRWGSLAYFHAFFRVMRRDIIENQVFTAEIITDEKKFQMESIQISVGNGRYYGGGMVVAEDSEIDDHELVLYTIKPQSFFELMRMAPSFITGRHAEFDRVIVLHGRKFEIHTDRPMTIDVDGELTQQTPGYFDILPDAMEIFVPAANAAKE
ncbi:MAG: lipid kinase [Desulfobulbaceae bacterium]|nr:lipid kinase [Desulfobulbaceae bacterium]